MSKITTFSHSLSLFLSLFFPLLHSISNNITECNHNCCALKFIALFLSMTKFCTNGQRQKSSLGERKTLAALTLGFREQVGNNSVFSSSENFTLILSSCASAWNSKVMVNKDLARANVFYFCQITLTLLTSVFVMFFDHWWAEHMWKVLKIVRMIHQLNLFQGFFKSIPLAPHSLKFLSFLPLS